MAWGKTDREGCKWRRPTLIPVYRLPAACRFLSSATPSLCGKKNNQLQCCRLKKESEKSRARSLERQSFAAPSAMPIDYLSLSPALAASPTSSPSTASPSGAGHSAIILALPVVNHGPWIEIMEWRGCGEKGRKKERFGWKKKTYKD
uniref:Uncharacterized protein n=1 Tax=Oryza sativa subsp. japonica TaxID=39947 RepID=Q10P37_ORYSJ|nr:hypothetical protein LOC_Os03g14430 [Oryza sativa Japonica Group]